MNESAASLTFLLTATDARILAEYLLIAQQAVLSAADERRHTPALDAYLRSHASQAADLRARVLRIKPIN